MKRLLSVLSLLMLVAAPAMAGGIYLNPLAVGGSIQTLPDVACTSTAAVVVPEDDGQLAAILTNVGAGAARCGDANVTASRGAQIASTTGEMVFGTYAAIYCYCATATTIAITKVER